MNQVAVLCGLVLGLAALLPGQDQPKKQPKNQPKKQPKKFEFTDPKDIPIPTEQSGQRTIQLTLDDALRRADKSNADLAVFRLGPLRSMQDIIVARAFFDSEAYADAGFSSQKDPTIGPFDAQKREVYDAEAGWRKRLFTGALFDLSVSAIQTEQAVPATAGINFPNEIYDTSVNVSLTQPLLRSAWWEYAEADIKRATAAQDGATSQFEQTRQDTLLEVVRGYWELVFAREDYRVQYQALELAQEQLRITEARIEVRDLAPRDKVADEAEVARRKEGLIVAENQIRAREDGLRALLFDDQGDETWEWVLRPITDYTPDLSKVDGLRWKDIAKAAMADRPELIRLQANVASAEQGLVIAETDTWPQLDLVGSYNSGAQRQDSFANSFGDVFGIDFPDWSLRLQFSYPIGNRAARARRDQSLLQLEETKRQVFAEKIRVRREVRDAVRNMKTLAESIRASAESVRLAENDLDTAQHKQRVGTLTPFDVQERNQELQQARSRLQRNQVDFRISEAVLKHAQGKLQPPEPEGASGETKR